MFQARTNVIALKLYVIVQAKTNENEITRGLIYVCIHIKNAKSI